MKSGTEMTILRPVILSLRSLENLTDLTLCVQELDVKLREILLSLVGNSCPLLTRLDVLGNDVFKNKKEICSIFMGESAYDTISSGSDEEPEWLSDDEFSRLKVPEKFLVPMCFTLKELRLSGYGKSSDYLEIYGSSSIFILRHLPLLEKFDLPLPIAVAIKSLYEQSQVKFEKEFETAFQRRVRGPSETNLKLPFSGKCLLFDLLFIQTYFNRK